MKTFFYFSDDDLCRKIKSLNKSIIQSKQLVYINMEI